jgi:hypothetical protein
MPEEDQTYYAKWSPKSYTVLYKSQDGTSILDTASVVYNNKPTYSAQEPVKASSAQYSYSFAGWALEINAESGTALGSLNNVSADITYYAAFTPAIQLYSVIFDDNDESNTISGLPNSIASQPYGTLLSALTDYETWSEANAVDGYNYGKYLLGWSLTKGGSIITGSEAIERATTLYAVWQQLASITISQELYDVLSNTGALMLHYYSNDDWWQAISAGVPYYIRYEHSSSFSRFELQFRQGEAYKYTTWIGTSLVLGTNYVPISDGWQDMGGNDWKVVIHLA